MTSRIVGPPVHLPFLEQAADAPFRWRLGVRPLASADWFEWGDTGDAAVAAKPAIMAEHAETVFAVLDDRVAEEGAELAAMIVDHLAEHEPHRDRVLDRSLHPLDAAARLVPDDLVLLVERDGQFVFGGGSLCFPNEWDLRSKLGRSIAEVHAPVAQLNDQLEHPIDLFFSRLVPERSWWRLGWGIIDTDDWFAPVRAPVDAPVRTPVDGSSGPWLRVERESLRRLPETNAVVFGIRTHLTALDQLPAPDRRHLAARIATLPDGVADYKGITAVRDDLISHLTRPDR